MRQPFNHAPPYLVQRLGLSDNIGIIWWCAFISWLFCILQVEYNFTYCWCCINAYI